MSVTFTTFTTKERESEVGVHGQMEVMMCGRVWKRSIYGNVKSSFVYCLRPRTDCEFKMLNLFYFPQSYIGTVHDNLEGTFIN